LELLGEDEPLIGRESMSQSIHLVNKVDCPLPNKQITEALYHILILGVELQNATCS
jgi:hypothetical protein